MSYTDPVLRHLTKISVQPEFGARPLERSIRTKVEDVLAEKMLSGTLEKGNAYTLRMEKNEVVVTSAEEA